MIDPPYFSSAAKRQKIFLRISLLKKKFTDTPPCFSGNFAEGGGYLSRYPLIALLKIPYRKKRYFYWNFQNVFRLRRKTRGSYWKGESYCSITPDVFAENSVYRLHTFFFQFCQLRAVTIYFSAQKKTTRKKFAICTNRLWIISGFTPYESNRLIFNEIFCKKIIFNLSTNWINVFCFGKLFQ